MYMYMAMVMEMQMVMGRVGQSKGVCQLCIFFQCAALFACQSVGGAVRCALGFCLAIGLVCQPLSLFSPLMPDYFT